MFGGEKLGGAKVFDFRLATVFSLGHRHSKHKITRHSKYLGGMTPCPPFATPMFGKGEQDKDRS